MADIIATLLQKHQRISDQVEPDELRAILRELEGAVRRGVPGDVVEFGCFAGTTSLFLRRMLDALGSAAELHVYDSFEGLPEKTAADASPAGAGFVPGALRASKRELRAHFRRAGLREPVIHKAWFSELTERDVPERIALAFLDGDYYDSIMDPLRLIWPRLSEGAVVVVDDYQNEQLPGASKAVDEWLRAHPARLRVEASLAIIRP